MNYFQDVLKLLPSQWDSNAYNNRRFILVDLCEDSNEYKEIAEDFYLNSVLVGTIVSIQRIQHPFAYARFHLRKEQFARISAQVNEMRWFDYVPGNLPQVETYIDYNCDERRLRYYESFVNEYVVVRKMLTGPQLRDSHWYPEYLVRCFYH